MTTNTQQPFDSDLLRKKMRFIFSKLKKAYGLRTMRHMVELVGIHGEWIVNIMRVKHRDLYFKNGPQSSHVYRFCKFYGLSIDYLLDETIPVKSGIWETVRFDIPALQLQYKRTGLNRIFHMAVGLFVGKLTEVCKCMCSMKRNTAVITLLEGEMEDLSYILRADKEEGFMVTHAYPGRPPSKDERLLNIGYIRACQQQLKNAKKD